jgi:hypothetical protein
MKNLLSVSAVIIISLFSVVLAVEPNTITINDKYPDLALGCLKYAKLAELPTGILVKSGDLTISDSDIAKEIEKNLKRCRSSLKRINSF